MDWPEALAKGLATLAGAAVFIVALLVHLDPDALKAIGGTIMTALVLVWIFA